jgi:hypothetical protein
MPLEPHSSLFLPPDDTILWRYMDLAKFLLLLESQSLWFSRADQFEDPLEGTYTDAEIQQLRSLDATNTALPSQISESYLRGARQMRATAYVSCWRAGGAESMEMWDLYGRGGATIAVKTTIGNLKAAISESPLRIFLAEVKYVDWDLAPFDNNNLVMCFRKDSSYEHEKEVRAVIWDVDLICRNMPDALMAARSRSDYPSSGSNPFTLQKLDGQRGIEVPFDPARFLTEVVVGPRETHSIGKLLKSILGRYGLKTKMSISNRLTPRE